MYRAFMVQERWFRLICIAGDYKRYMLIIVRKSAGAGEEGGRD